MKYSELDILKFTSGKNFGDENFPVSSFLISPQKKLQIRKFYKFARIADDIADNKKLSSKKKIEILNFFDDCLANKTRTKLKFLDELIEIFIAQNLSLKNARKLLIAFKLDATKLRYKTWQELIDYCSNSASPVGRFVIELHLKKICNKQTLRKIFHGSDKLCNCLQILNHFQDIKDDLQNLNRVYIPIEMFNDEKDLIKSIKCKKSSTKFEKIKLFYLNKIDILLKESESLLWLIPQKSLKRETFVILYIAKKLTELLKKNDPLKKKVKLSYIDLIFCYFKGIIKVLKNNKSFKSM